MAAAIASDELKATEREIVMTRVFAAPRSMVWGAFADPWQVGQWWGPKGFRTTMTEMDLRPGGKWRLVMHGPDGTNYPNEVTFLEVVPMEKVVLELSGGKEGAETVRFQQTISFTDEDGGTRLTIRIAFPSAEERDRNVREYRSIEGGRQMFDRLEAHLQEKDKPAGGATHELSITRVFNAPRELVWQAWTDPAMAKQWSGPKVFPAFHVELGRKPGDRWRIGLRGMTPGSDTVAEIWQGGVLKEFVPPERLVYTYAWEDRSAVGLPADGAPHDTTITVRLEERDGKTTMHFSQAFFATASERDGHNGGWSSSFERLAELVEAEAEKGVQ